MKKTREVLDSLTIHWLGVAKIGVLYENGNLLNRKHTVLSGYGEKEALCLIKY